MANEKGKWGGGSKKESFLASLSPYESENTTDSVILGKKGVFDLFKRLGIHEYQLDNAVMRTFEGHIGHTFCTRAKNKTYLCVNKEAFLKRCAVLIEDPIPLTKKIETLRKKWIQTKSVKHDTIFCEKVKKRMLTDITDRISHLKDEAYLAGRLKTLWMKTTAFPHVEIELQKQLIATLSHQAKYASEAVDCLQTSKNANELAPILLKQILTIPAVAIRRLVLDKFLRYLRTNGDNAPSSKTLTCDTITALTRYLIEQVWTEEPTDTRITDSCLSYLENILRTSGSIVRRYQKTKIQEVFKKQFIEHYLSVSSSEQIFSPETISKSVQELFRTPVKKEELMETLLQRPSFTPTQANTLAKYLRDVPFEKKRATVEKLLHSLESNTKPKETQQLAFALFQNIQEIPKEIKLRVDSKIAPLLVVGFPFASEKLNLDLIFLLNALPISRGRHKLEIALAQKIPMISNVTLWTATGEHLITYAEAALSAKVVEGDDLIRFVIDITANLFTEPKCTLTPNQKDVFYHLHEFLVSLVTVNEEPKVSESLETLPAKIQFPFKETIDPPLTGQPLSSDQAISLICGIEALTESPDAAENNIRLHQIHEYLPHIIPLSMKKAAGFC
jgi:hypothetical protein